MKTKQVLTFLIAVFFISTLLAPVFILNKLCFISICFVMLAKLRTNSKIYTIAPLVVFGVFLFGFIVSFFNVVDRELSNQFMLSVAVLFLIYPIRRYQIDLDPIIKKSAIFMVVLTLIYFLIIVAFPGNLLYDIVYNVFTKYTLGAFGLRDFSEEATLSFHIGTVPFLYLPLSLYFISYLETKNSKYIIIIIIILVVIVVSASRGVLITSILCLTLLYFLSLKLSKKLVFIAISIPIFIIISSYLITNTTTLSTSEESNSIKIRHIESFFDNISITNFFIGDGLAAFYYSKGVGALRAHTEITPFDMLRYFGFILMPVLYIAIVFPSGKFSMYMGENRVVTLIFLLFLLNTFANPIMFNSYGLLIVLWYWSKILLPREKNICEEQILMRH